MSDITIGYAWQWLLAAAAALVALSKAFEILKNAFKKTHPSNDEINGIKTKVAKLEKDFSDVREFQTVICRVLLAQLNHDLSGNDVNKLREARDELNEYLTRR